MAMFNLLRASYESSRAGNKKSTGDEKYHPPSAYDFSIGANDDDESTMTLLGDKWEKRAGNHGSKIKSIFYLVLGLFASASAPLPTSQSLYAPCKKPSTSTQLASNSTTVAAVTR